MLHAGDEGGDADPGPDPDLAGTGVFEGETAVRSLDNHGLADPPGVPQGTGEVAQFLRDEGEPMLGWGPGRGDGEGMRLLGRIPAHESKLAWLVTWPAFGNVDLTLEH